MWSQSSGFITLFIAFAACILIAIKFERERRSTMTLVMIATMTALSILGRILFAALPSIKPVTAMTVICAMYLGPEAGFFVGALTALVSNFYFGQGPWTPVQMLSWGVIGLLAGWLSGLLRRNKACLLVFGAFAGVLYSFLMDVWTVFWLENRFLFTRYLAVLATSLSTTVIYAVSNVVFLVLLAKPLGQKLERMTVKYGIGKERK